MKFPQLFLSPQIRLMRIIWSLLLAKCFALEFLVQYYEVPINSIYYVWTLSILMASTATYLYLAKEFGANKRYRTTMDRPALFSLAAVCAIFSILCLLWTHRLSQGAALTSIAATFTLYFGIRGWTESLRLPFYSAFIWALATYLITTLNNIQQLSLYSVAILMGMTIPELIVYIRKRNEISAALQTLNTPSR